MQVHYNLVFTWSETGDGQFQYMDTKTGETVVMKDRKGWQCKAGYFGSYGEAWTKKSISFCQNRLLENHSFLYV